MARSRLETRTSRQLVVRPAEAPIGLYLDPESDELAYFSSEAEADATIPASVIDEARASFGAWADLGLDWDDVERDLDKIRHGRSRTPAKSA